MLDFVVSFLVVSPFVSVALSGFVAVTPALSVVVSYFFAETVSLDVPFVSVLLSESFNCVADVLTLSSSLLTLLLSQLIRVRHNVILIIIAINFFIKNTSAIGRGRVGPLIHKSSHLPKD